MNASCRHLGESDFPEIYRTFIEAFSDYALDMRYMNENVLYNRAVKNGVDFSCSAGAFQDGRMIGFTLVGTGERLGKRSAFDIATGVVKSCRGRGVVGTMFDSIVPRLANRGIERFFLEVLRENAPAMRAYERIGFRTVRILDCFELPVERVDPYIASPADVEIRETDKNDIDRFRPFFDWMPSWENSPASIRRIPDEVHMLSASLDGDSAGVLVYYPCLNWILCLAVDPIYRRRGIATRLLRHLLRSVPVPNRTLKLNNVPGEDRGMIAFLRKTGFEKYTSQFEMCLEL